MSAVAIVRALLTARPAVTAVVPAARIFSGIVPQGTALPAIGIREVSGYEEPTVARRMARVMIRSRVQVTVYAANYVQMKQLVALAKLGGGVHTGVIAGIPVNSVTPDGVGPEVSPADDKIFEQSRDFMVTFREANL